MQVNWAVVPFDVGSTCALVSINTPKQTVNNLLPSRQPQTSTSIGTSRDPSSGPNIADPTTADLDRLAGAGAGAGAGAAAAAAAAVAAAAAAVAAAAAAAAAPAEPAGVAA